MNLKTEQPRKVQFVIKTSKLCNLRCRYCYEYLELGDRQAMTLDQLDTMYRHIASYYNRFDFKTEIQFVWHGGEPLLHSPDYYWQTFDRQQEIFGKLASSVTNVVQTNLTTLNQERLDLLAEGFDGVGVSIDLFGGLRTTQTEKDSVITVLKNIDRLIQNKIKFGCITVLTKASLPYLQEIFSFYEKMNVHFRLLPLFDGAFDGQHQGFEITPAEVLPALCDLVDMWMTSQTTISIQPISEHIATIIRHYSPEVATYFYDKAEWESIYLVNVNGDVFSYGDGYDPNFCHGNLFTTPLEQIALSPVHQQVISRAEERMMTACSSCKYFGSCSGYPMAEEAMMTHQVDSEGNPQCIVTKGILEHIEMRFIQAGVIDPLTGRINDLDLIQAQIDRLSETSSPQVDDAALSRI
jgi:uncharacterized protein